MLNISVEDILDCRGISSTALIAQNCTNGHVKYCFVLSTHSLFKNTTVSVEVCLGRYIHFLKHAGSEADFFLLVCAGDSHGWRHHALGLSVYSYVSPSVTFSSPQHRKNASRECLSFLFLHSHRLIRLWCSVVKVTVTSQKQSNRFKMMKWWYFISSGSKVTSPWHHNVLHQKKKNKKSVQEQKGRSWPYFIFSLILNWWN